MPQALLLYQRTLVGRFYKKNLDGLDFKSSSMNYNSKLNLEVQTYQINEDHPIDWSVFRCVFYNVEDY